MNVQYATNTVYYNKKVLILSLARLKHDAVRLVFLRTDKYTKGHVDDTSGECIRFAFEQSWDRMALIMPPFTSTRSGSTKRLTMFFSPVMR